MKAGDFIYSRYIPNADGAYERRPVDETPFVTEHRQETPARQSARPPESNASAQRTGCTLRRILPEGFDTGDLLILLILLLMLLDSQEDSMSILLTIAFFFFL